MSGPNLAEKGLSQIYEAWSNSHFLQILLVTAELVTSYGDTIKSIGPHIYEIREVLQCYNVTNITWIKLLFLVWIIFPMKTVSLEFYTRWKENNQVVKLILNWILEFEFSVFYHNRKILFALFSEEKNKFIILNLFPTRGQEANNA